MNIQWKQITRYRNVWMGAAISLIILYHMNWYFSSQTLNFFKNMGYGGVDICLLASGLGCYFSLNKDSSTLRFLKRRVTRLAPTYIPFIIGWFFYAFKYNEWFSWNAVIGNLLGIQNLLSIGNTFNWYISGLVVYYMLAPLFKETVDTIRTLWGHLVVVGLLVCVSFTCWNTSDLLMITTRLPVFYLGMVLARYSLTHENLSVRDLILAAAGMVLGTVLLSYWMVSCPEHLWSRGLLWYPFILITPGVCVVISVVCSLLERTRATRWMIRVMNFIGNNSFELYLVHVMVFYYYGTHCNAGYSKREWFALLIPVAIGCVVLKLIARVITAVGKKLNKSEQLLKE